MNEVSAALRGTLKHPEHEPLLEGIRAAVCELKEPEIVDEKGNRVRTNLPEDMKEGADRDFGG